MIGRKNTTAVLFTCFVAGALPAQAATHEEIVESCRQSVGRPIVQACMGGRRDMLEECRKKATPAVRACVIKEEQRIAATKAAPAAPKDKEEEAALKGDRGAVAAGFVAPPRTISDITAILDSEKPDPAKIALRKQAADAEPPKGGSKSALAQFYYDRGNARASLARNEDALNDALKAWEVGQGGFEERQDTRIIQFVGLQYLAAGRPKEAVDFWLKAVGLGEHPGRRGAMINAARGIAQAYVAMGDVTQADAFARRVIARVQEARGSPHPKWREVYKNAGSSWEADSDLARALIFEARGQYREAEAAYRRSEAFRRVSVADSQRLPFPPPREQVLAGVNGTRLSIARMEARQSRLAEAEADARKALLAALGIQGKYHPATAKYITGLAAILLEQGRYADAEKLNRSALDVLRTVGIAEDSPVMAGTLSDLGNILTLQHKDREAIEAYAELEHVIAKWEPNRREAFLLSGSRIIALYASNRVDAGIAAAEALVKRQQKRVSEGHYDIAWARGTLAIGYARAGRNADAIREFKLAIPPMIAAARENSEDDDSASVAARSQILQTIVEAYIAVLAKDSNRNAEVAVETFALADAVRGRSVQQALAASSARMAAKDPALAELVRVEQDHGKQINALLATLNNTLSMPAAERDEAGIRAINATLVQLRADRKKARDDINRRFPAYADLVDPKPPTVDQIAAALRSDEAFLSFYFGRDVSFVWAVSKTSPVAFAAIPATATELEAKVRQLRKALDPQAAMISDIPAFDVGLGYELYALLLKPVEQGWKSAKNLVVVTNGALGLLPLSLLPTARVEVAQQGPAFAGYAKVPWLARTHAVTMVPSAAALRTLRALPPGPATRGKLIAFGDPYFSETQASEAENDKPMTVASADGVATRSVPLKRRSSPQTQGVDSAELALLPRLPDTADELRSIALALEADPTKALHLGKEANEGAVRKADLSGFKVIVFATHGLVPGDLNGLTQPALALTAPKVAAVEGDGLLTMEEILTLKLDADWVVLSACNTGAGSGAGAEAASGLGRAFFYAGTRAILVTNWSVHSQSARELVSDLFRRQAADPKLTRAVALQQAMNALIDGQGFVDEKGSTLFSYAHPLFWAPYSLIGDGG
jgi:CHAT domain-containing protein